MSSSSQDAGTEFCSGSSECTVDACNLACLEQDGNCNKASWEDEVQPWAKWSASDVGGDLGKVFLQGVLEFCFWRGSAEKILKDHGF